MTIAGDTTSPEVQFSDEIRNASWNSHEQAEQSPFMSALLGGTLEPNRYAQLAVQHYFIYDVLEQASASMAGDPFADPFVKPELTRIPALERDLVALLGAGWKDEIVPADATRAYCDRMREVCFDSPGSFVAHHYVRYMGDVSGGQHIRRVLQKTYGLDVTNGAAFYVFPEMDFGAFKREYRELLNSTEWPAVERSRIIEEVQRAYQLNIQLLADL